MTGCQWRREYVVVERVDPHDDVEQKRWSVEEIISLCMRKSVEWFKHVLRETYRIKIEELILKIYPQIARRYSRRDGISQIARWSSRRDGTRSLQVSAADLTGYSAC